jgi:N-methylhydantoinase A
MTPESMQEMIGKFHDEHNRSYGYFNKSMRIQMVNYRITAVGAKRKPDMKEHPVDPDVKVPAPIEAREVLFEGQTGPLRTDVYQREALVPGHRIYGPAIIEQMDSTSIIPPGWEAVTDGFGNIRAVRSGGKK